MDRDRSEPSPHVRGGPGQRWGHIYDVQGVRMILKEGGVVPTRARHCSRFPNDMRDFLCRRRVLATSPGNRSPIECARRRLEEGRRGVLYEVSEQPRTEE